MFENEGGRIVFWNLPRDFRYVLRKLIFGRMVAIVDDFRTFQGLEVS